MIRVLLVCSLCVVALCYQKFQMEIPNGATVPDPCAGQSGMIWNGVGHNNLPGGGKNNQFGLDFNSTGQVWTKDLCMKDSDQDGKTNGEELGDKDCTWKKGDTLSTKAIGHPGICEPMSDAKCTSINKDIICTQRNKA